MWKSISSDAIIGNFIIESIEKNDFSVELKKLDAFDTELSGRLAQHNYYTNFNIKDVSFFRDQYPFLIESYNDEGFRIAKKNWTQEELRDMLLRYFRYGMPKVVINEMKQTLQTVLGRQLQQEKLKQRIKLIFYKESVMEDLIAIDKIIELCKKHFVNCNSVYDEPCDGCQLYDICKSYFKTQPQYWEVIE